MNVTGLASAPLVIATDPVGVYLLDLLAEGGGGGPVSREALVAGVLDRAADAGDVARLLAACPAPSEDPAAEGSR